MLLIYIYVYVDITLCVCGLLYVELRLAR
jgi:hypothetical protein